MGGIVVQSHQIVILSLEATKDLFHVLAHNAREVTDG